MTKLYQPELGQMIFGCPTGDYDVGELGQACLQAVLSEIDRVFWNREQRAWDRYEDPKIEGIEFRPYYWGEDETERARPNLACHGVEIRWYKHPGRGTSVHCKMTAVDWDSWLIATLETVCAGDKLT